MKYYLIFFFLLNFLNSAQGAETSSHWFMATAMRYEKAEDDFQYSSTKAEIIPDDAIALFGGEMRIGGELSLFKKFSLIISLEGFYSQNTSKDIIKPDDKTVDVSLQEEIIKMKSYGLTAYAGVGLFPFKVKHFLIQPIIEIGFGSGQVKKDASFFHDDTVSVFEYYQEEVKQDFTLFKVGLGFDVMISSGLYSYFRFYSLSYNFESSLGTRKESLQPNFNNPAITQVPRPDSRYTVFASSIGFGYRF